MNLKVVKARQEHICMGCGKLIEPETECLQFYRSHQISQEQQAEYYKKQKNNDATVFKRIVSGWLWFKHWECQFNKYPRSRTLEEFKETVRNLDSNRKRNLKIKRLQKQYLDGKLITKVRELPY